MVPVADRTNKNIAGDNWADNLLVKESDGKLGYFKAGGKAVHGNPVANVKPINNSKATINTAPLDDSFVATKIDSDKADHPAQFVFHPDDQQEIESIAAQNLQDDSKKYGIEKIVNRLIEKHNLQLDQDNKKVFTDAIYNFFRNRKKAIVTRETLTTKILSDKSNLKSEIVDSILSVIKALKQEIDAKGGLVIRMSELKQPEIEPLEKVPVYELDEGEEGKLVEDEIKEALLAIEPSIKDKEEEPSTDVQIEEKITKEAKEPAEEKEEIKPAIVPVEKPKEIEVGEPDIVKPVTVKFELPEETVAPKEVVEEKKIEDAQLKHVELPEIKQSLPTVSRPDQKTGTKNQMSDVISANKPLTARAPILAKDVLTGPVKELQSMDLINFRRLGNSATERADKILDKINLLEQDSYTKQAQGVAGWRNSSIYRQYLELGAESMVSGQEVAALIEQYKSQNKETLDLEEFSAISDLNKKLRF